MLLCFESESIRISFVCWQRDSIDKLQREEKPFIDFVFFLLRALKRSMDLGILTLRLKRERRHRAILLANSVDTGLVLVHVSHAARLFQTNAFSVAQVYQGVLVSMNLPY